MWRCTSFSLYQQLSSTNPGILLHNIVALKKEFGVEVGLSDHTISNIAAITAIGLGAVAIEKHFKPKDDMVGPDSSFSLTPSQLESLTADCRLAWQSLGPGGFHRPKVEENSRKYRRSLYFMSDLEKGSVVTSEDIRAIRPGFGLSPKYVNDVIGKVVNCTVERGDPVTFEVFFVED